MKWLSSISAGLTVAGLFLGAPVQAQQAVIARGNDFLSYNLANGQSTNFGNSGPYIALVPGSDIMLSTDGHSEILWENLVTFEAGYFPEVMGAPSVISVTPDGRVAYVVDETLGLVSALNVQTKATLATIQGLQAPVDMKINPNGQTAYISESRRGTLTRLDLRTNNIIDRIPVLMPPGKILLSPDGAMAYVAHLSDTLVMPVALIVPGNGPPAVGPAINIGFVPKDLAVTPDSRFVFVSDCSGHLVKIDTTDENLQEPFVIPAPPAGGCTALTMAPDGRKLYLSDGQSASSLDVASSSMGAPFAGDMHATNLLLPAQRFVEDVIFLGDSVTAGFGFCGPNEPAGLLTPGCGVNLPFSDLWAGTAWSLQQCKPLEGKAPDDRCSNNNSGGMPWTAPPWAAGANAPTVSYSWVIAGAQTPGGAVPVRNWAVTGSEPRHWDNATDLGDKDAGVFSALLKSIKNRYVVLTLGANPLLSMYIKISVPGFDLQNGVCADSTFTTNGGIDYATALSIEAADGGQQYANGVGYCFNQQWARIGQADHLKNIYSTLLANGNRVVVVGYPPVCPWSFGNWQSKLNIRAPSKGNPCTAYHYPTAWRDWPNPVNNPDLTQADQAFFLAKIASLNIWEIIYNLHNPNIIYIFPDPAWKDHQTWSAESWVFDRDTGIHPNVAGHRQLASSVEAAMCAAWGKWCPSSNIPGSAPAWAFPYMRLPPPQAAQ